MVAVKVVVKMTVKLKFNNQYKNDKYKKTTYKNIDGLLFAL